MDQVHTISENGVNRTILFTSNYGRVEDRYSKKRLSKCVIPYLSFFKVQFALLMHNAIR